MIATITYDKWLVRKAAHDLINLISSSLSITMELINRLCIKILNTSCIVSSYCIFRELSVPNHLTLADASYFCKIKCSCFLISTHFQGQR